MEDRIYASPQQRSDGLTGLLGKPSEGTFMINDIPASALLNTGSTDNTVSESSHRQYLADQDIQPLGQILHIECATKCHTMDSSPLTISCQGLQRLMNQNHVFC